MPTPRLPGTVTFCDGRVALNLGRGALDPQELGRVAEAGAVVEVDLEPPLGAPHPDLDGQGPCR